MPTAVHILLATSVVSFLSLVGVIFVSVREALLTRLAGLRKLSESFAQVALLLLGLALLWAAKSFAVD